MTSALILAAGCILPSEKRGPMEIIGEVSSIKRVITVFRKAGVKKIVVVTGFSADSLEKHCSRLGVIFLRNNDYETGDMLSSVKVGLTYLKDKCEKVFISPADIPFFSADTVKSMEGMTESVVIPVYSNKTGHPLLLSHDIFNRVLEYSGSGGLEAALSGGEVERKFFDVQDKGILADTKKSAVTNGADDSHNARKIWPDIKLMLSGDKGFFGPGALQLLSLTGETGSLRQASQQMGISYSKAWKMITEIETQLGFPILRSQVGGRTGGGSELTGECLDFMKRYNAFMSECEEFIKTAFEKHFG